MQSALIVALVLLVLLGLIRMWKRRSEEAAAAFTELYPGDARTSEAGLARALWKNSLPDTYAAIADTTDSNERVRFVRRFLSLAEELHELHARHLLEFASHHVQGPESPAEAYHQAQAEEEVGSFRSWVPPYAGKMRIQDLEVARFVHDHLERERNASSSADAMEWLLGLRSRFPRSDLIWALVCYGHAIRADWESVRSALPRGQRLAQMSDGIVKSMFSGLQQACEHRRP